MEMRNKSVGTLLEIATGQYQYGRSEGVDKFEFQHINGSKNV